MSKPKLLLMYGGRSGEHEVSLASAASVLKALDKQLYQITCLAGDKCGNWFITPAEDFIEQGIQTSLPIKTEASKQISLSTELFNDIYVVLPIMHGPLFEDGCLQGLLELSNVAYMGSDPLSSAMAMDKVITKLLVSNAGIDIAPFKVIHTGNDLKTRENICQQAVEQFGFPLFVKPACLGSSVGIHRVCSEKDLQTAVQDAFCYDHKILIEKYVPGREIELAVLKQKHEITVSLAGEIRMAHKDDFYSYDAKYQNETAAQLIFPAELSPSALTDLQAAAKTVFQTVGCEGLARVDFFLTEDNHIILNEINTLPGFTQISMYPKLWQISGIDYTELLTKLIHQARWRFDFNREKVRDFF